MTINKYISYFLGIIFLLVGLFQFSLTTNAASNDTLTITNNLEVLGFDDSTESLYICVDGGSNSSNYGKVDQGETVNLSGDFTTDAGNRRLYLVWHTDIVSEFGTNCNSTNSVSPNSHYVANFPLSDIVNGNIEISGELGVAGQPRTLDAIKDFGLSSFNSDFYSTPGETSFSLIQDQSGNSLNVTLICIDGKYAVEDESGFNKFFVTPGNHELFIPTTVGNPGEDCPENDFRISLLDRVFGNIAVEAQATQNPLSTITAIENNSIPLFIRAETNPNLDPIDVIDGVKIFSDGNLIWEYTPAISGGGLFRTGGYNNSVQILLTIFTIIIGLTGFLSLKLSK